MEKIMWIGAGGAVGAVLRYAISGAVQGMAKDEGFPFGTLAVNLLGCLLIGSLLCVAEMKGTFSADARAFIFIGLLGALTTFSTFSNDSMTLLQNGGGFSGMLLNIGANTGLGLLMVWLGSLLGGWVCGGGA